MKSVVSGIILLVIGGVIGYWMAGGFKPHERQFVVLHGGGVFYAAAKGDVLSWYRQGDATNPVQVKFPNSPCQEGDGLITQCTLNVSGGLYPYQCDGCRDPGVGGGSHNGGLLPPPIGPGPRVSSQGQAFTPFFMCDKDGNAKVDNVAGAHTQDTVQWTSNGSVSGTITVPQGLCSKDTSFTPDNTFCTLQAPFPSSPYTYTVHVDQCTGQKDASGTIEAQ